MDNYNENNITPEGTPSPELDNTVILNRDNAPGQNNTPEQQPAQPAQPASQQSFAQNAQNAGQPFAPNAQQGSAPAGGFIPMRREQYAGQGASQQNGGYNPYADYPGGSAPRFAPPVYTAPSFSAQSESKKKRSVWPFILVGVAVFLIIVVLLAVAIASIEPETSSVLPGTGEEYVAVLYIDTQIAGDYVKTSLYGTYSSYNQVFYIDTLRELALDDTNAGLMLYINSPGGEVTATDELSRAIVEYKQTTGRPVYAYFADMAASGGYWIGCHADKIIASKFCTTGSIGVTYGTHLEISGLLEKLGITVTELTAGENKAMGSMYSPLTEEQKEMYEEQLEEMHELFVDTVAKNRGLKKEDVRKIADGRTFLASKALEYKLIDDIAYWNEAQAMMLEECSLDEGTVFYDFLPDTSYSTDIFSLLYGMAEKNGTDKPDPDSVAALVEAVNESRRFMALYQG